MMTEVVPHILLNSGAELQEKQSCNNPALIRIEVNAGHGTGRTFYRPSHRKTQI